MQLRPWVAARHASEQHEMYTHEGCAACSPGLPALRRERWLLAPPLTDLPPRRPSPSDPSSSSSSAHTKTGDGRACRVHSHSGQGGSGCNAQPQQAHCAWCLPWLAAPATPRTCTEVLGIGTAPALGILLHCGAAAGLAAVAGAAVVAASGLAAGFGRHQHPRLGRQQHRGQSACGVRRVLPHFIHAAGEQVAPLRGSRGEPGQQAAGAGAQSACSRL